MPYFSYTMSIIKTEIRQGAYYDSIILMQLQAGLADLSGVENVGVMMGTEANKALLKQTNLLTAEAKSALPDDLIIAVQGHDEATVIEALTKIDELLVKRHSAIEEMDYLPQSIEAASKMLPDANWVLVSVPGRYAADVAREALRFNKHVFLYSDNVSTDDEIALKNEAASKGLLVMGADCGTAIVNGIGLGFANQVRRGPIGVVGASGTGLQHVTARIHQLGSGITHALGTGGRDLSETVGAITTRQSLDLLSRDPDTQVIVLISKPPAKSVADNLLRLARSSGKPVIINFIGYHHPAEIPGIQFARTLDHAAELAVMLIKLASTGKPTKVASSTIETTETPEMKLNQARYLRGLFSGGTLAYEALLVLQDYLPVVYSNAPLDEAYKLPNLQTSQSHTIVDLGDDEFTIGRLHPMMDNRLRIQRIQHEVNDPEVALILLDVMLGHGAHPDPASELAPAIQAALEQAKNAGRNLEIVTLVCGTDEDPQDMAAQIEQLQNAGAHVETNNETAVRYVGQQLQSLNQTSGLAPVSLSTLDQPLAVINVGLESFTASLQTQQAAVIHVNWRPPAGGNQKLMDILARMKK
ncbi:acyl-CoA synthetase FdrA [Anaerolineales bacterium HSG24]|nr:acyl-CoA synthetase FdrA [Anaerolineales bacterium HSG24]